MVLCLTLTTCKHEPPEEPEPICQYDSSIEEMKKWYYFKEGTKWIYQEETTGELDTATVYESSEGDWWFDYHVFHSYGGWINHYSFDTSWSIYCLTSKKCNCHKINKSRFKPGNFVGEGNIFVYPNIVGNYNNLISSNGMEGGRSTLVDFMDTLEIGGQSFSDVIHWEVELDGSMADEFAEYHISRNIGIIKMTYPESNKSWILIDYTILQ